MDNQANNRQISNEFYLIIDKNWDQICKDEYKIDNMKKLNKKYHDSRIKAESP